MGVQAMWSEDNAMTLENIFTPEELASIDAGTYDITRPVLAMKLNLWAALEREECAKVCEEIGGAEPADCADAIRARSKT